MHFAIITCEAGGVRFDIEPSGLNRLRAYGLDQPCLFLISISHISLSGGTRRYLPGFIPPPERALATIRSHNVRNSGLASGRSSHKERASSNLACDQCALGCLMKP